MTHAPRLLSALLMLATLAAACSDDSGGNGTATDEACTFQPGDATAAQARNVTALTLDGDTLWVGTDDQGLIQTNVDGSSSTAIGMADGLAAESIQAITITQDGRVWLAHGRAICSNTSTGYCGISVGDGTDWTIIGNEQLLSDRVFAIDESPAGTLWLGTSDGALFSSDGADWNAWFDWQDCNNPGDHCEPLFSFTVQDIDVDPQTGDAWFAVNQQQLGVSPKPGGVARRSADGLTDTWDRSDELPSNRATSIVVVNGTVWAGSPIGLARLEPTTQTWVTELELNINAITAQGDQLWVATDEGAQVLRSDGTWDTWTTDQGLPNNSVQALTANDDVVCLGTAAGVGCYRSSTCSWSWP